MMFVVHVPRSIIYTLRPQRHVIVLTTTVIEDIAFALTVTPRSRILQITEVCTFVRHYLPPKLTQLSIFPG